MLWLHRRWRLCRQPCGCCLLALDSAEGAVGMCTQLSAALERVRAGADIMPRKQLEKVMVAELGADWRSKLADFDFEPLAAASIGQVGPTRE